MFGRIAWERHKRLIWAVFHALTWLIWLLNGIVTLLATLSQGNKKSLSDMAKCIFGHQTLGSAKYHQCGFGLNETLCLWQLSRVEKSPWKGWKICQTIQLPVEHKTRVHVNTNLAPSEMYFLIRTFLWVGNSWPFLHDSYKSVNFPTHLLSDEQCIESLPDSVVLPVWL